MPLIEIFINAGKAKGDKKPAEQKDIGARRRSKERQPRRLRAGGFINFYDLGQRTDGAGGWADLTYKTGTFSNSSGAWRSDPLTLAQWRGLESDVFTVDVATWRTSYRKLGYEDAERYGIDILDPGERASTSDAPLAVHSAGRTGSRWQSVYASETPINGEKWTSTGLELAAADLSGGAGKFHVASAGISLPFGAGEASMKVTASRDYDAPAVTFELLLGQPVDVFLMPKLVNAVAFDPAQEFAARSETISPYKTMPRALLRSLVADDIGPMNLNPPLLSWAGLYTLGLTAAKLQPIFDYFAGDADARTFVVDPSTGNPMPAPGGYTGAMSQVYIDAVGDFNVGAYKTGVTGATPLAEGVLLGVIEQAGERYYFWNTGADATLANPFSNAVSSKYFSIYG